MSGERLAQAGSEIGGVAPPARPADGHKGTFGTVVMLAGCAAMPGAAALCGRGAFRAGAGLVKLAAPPEVWPVVQTQLPSVTAMTYDQLSEVDWTKPGTVLAAGPGLGTDGAAADALARVVQGPSPLVLDADGLNLMAAGRVPPRSAGKPWVMTPHPGEYRRLAAHYGVQGDPVHAHARADAARALAGVTGAVVVLKGAGTVISDGQRVVVNATGNPALATAGSGDVLTGVIAGLIAQGMEVFEAAVLGAHVHGAAADAWAAQHGTAGLLAAELADAVPRVLWAGEDP